MTSADIDSIYTSHPDLEQSGTPGYTGSWGTFVLEIKTIERTNIFHKYVMRENLHYTILPYLSFEIGVKYCSMFKFGIMYGQLKFPLFFTHFWGTFEKGKFRIRGTLNTFTRPVWSHLISYIFSCHDSCFHVIFQIRLWGLD